MDALRKRIRDKEITVAIVGLGYVGLPLACEFAEAGVKVIGVDVDAARVRMCNKGQSYIQDIASDRLKPLTKTKQLVATTDFKTIATADAISICVPTPLRKTKHPDMSYIAAAVDAIATYIQPGQVIVLESTTYPGTTEEFVLPKLEASSLKVGEDFFLAFSPERVDPGNKTYTTKNTPKVLGGVTNTCTKMAKMIYQMAIKKIVTVSSPKAAEMVKLLENTFRSVNIAMANEMALMCDKLDVDVWEVVNAAATKPFGFMPFYPGPGLGGHCIPIDPFYLSWKLKTLNYDARFIALAGEVNEQMPYYVRDKVLAGLALHDVPIKKAKVLLIGVAYKADINDCRESPALDVMELLTKKGVTVSYHDPYVPKLSVGAHELSSKPLSKKALNEADLVVIMTHHKTIDMSFVVEHASCIVDTRNATQGHRADHVIGL